MAILPPKLAVLLAGADSITQYAWDSRNRLVRIQSSEVDAAFKYDALGRRIERTINGDTTQYLYDGDQAIAELRNGAVSAHILTGLQIDEVIARYTTQGERTLLTDALGSVLISTKEDGTVATAYGYSSYGEVQLLGSDEQNSIQYTARENDGTGLYYYRARYYDPQLKRFVSEDPIGINGGLNIYAYVGGDPVNSNDPLGLAPKGGKPKSGNDVANYQDRYNDAQNSTDASSAAGSLVCIFTHKNCIDPDTLICVEWECTPKCGDKYRVYAGQPSITNPDTPCQCLRKAINPNYDKPLPGY